MSNQRGMLPRPGIPPFLQRFRAGRPELPADWAMLTDDQIRARLTELGYSKKMIEDEVRRYNEYKKRQASPKPKPPEDEKPTVISKVKSALDDALKGGE